MTELPDGNGKDRLDRIEAIVEATIERLVSLVEVVANERERNLNPQMQTERNIDLLVGLTRQLVETQSELIQNQKQLVDTQKQLIDTQKYLASTQGQLANTQQSLAAGQERQDRVLDYLIRRDKQQDRSGL